MKDTYTATTSGAAAHAQRLAQAEDVDDRDVDYEDLAEEWNESELACTCRDRDCPGPHYYTERS